MTTTKKQITISMSDRRPLTIVADDWPSVSIGEEYSGQHEFQAFDGASIRVRQHADGRAIVSGYAGDWDGGGRPERENRRAGFLVPADGDVVRAIRRVAGILADTDHVGDMAHAAARRCIADLPAESLGDTPVTRPITMPIDGAKRLLATLDEVSESGHTGIDPMLATKLRAVADELRAVFAK
jgi:hypothetical protein